MQIVPTNFQQRSGNFDVDISLGGQLVNLQFVWNSRAQFFFLTVTDEEGNLLRSVKVVPNKLLLRQYRGAIVFNGDLVVYPAYTNSSELIQYEDLGRAWLMYYLNEEESQTWLELNGI